MVKYTVYEHIFSFCESIQTSKSVYATITGLTVGLRHCTEDHLKDPKSQDLFDKPSGSVPGLGGANTSYRPMAAQEGTLAFCDWLLWPCFLKKQEEDLPC